LYTGFCYRIAPGRWRLVAGERIPTRENGHARSTAQIMLEVNQAFEAAVRRDPSNWFWVHKRWKHSKPRLVPRTSPTRDPDAESATSAGQAVNKTT